MATELPEYFKCPISLEIMSDPVILSSGHTFDRASIQRWIDAGHRTCPITKLPLPDPPILIPNHALRSLISNYTPLPPTRPNSDPDSLSQLGSLISTLTSPKSSSSAKLDSLSQLASLSKSNPTFRQRLTESGAVSLVLRCVDSDDPAIQEKSLSLLLTLSLDDDNNKVGLVAEGAVGKLVAALHGRAPAVAATVLTSLAVVEVNKATIGAFPGAVGALVRLLRAGRGGRERKEAATALFALCSFPENRRRAVDCGAVPVLARAAGSGLERAVEVMGLLGKCQEGREEMIKCDGVVEILVGFVTKNNGRSSSSSSRGVQYGLLTLNSLCSCSERIKDEVRKHGVLEVCLGLIEDDNEKIRRVASSLAEILQDDAS